MASETKSMPAAAQDAIGRATAVVGEDETRSERPSLRDRDASQVRAEQLNGEAVPTDGGPEGNATLRRVWSEPGGEAENYRNAMVGAGGKADNHTDLTEAETPPDVIRRISDPSLPPGDKGTSGSGGEG